MTQDLRAVILRYASGAIARPIIDDQNGQAHATFDVDDDAADRLFGVERRDDDTRGWHRDSLHGRTNGVRTYIGLPPSLEAGRLRNGLCERGTQCPCA